MNAWTIYWVMQLDTIIIAVALLSVALIVSAVTALVSGLSLKDTDRTYRIADAETSVGRGDKLIKLSKKLAAGFVLAITVSTLLPTSRTAAAMIILPAIANNDQVKQEAADLYGLAKQALANLAGTK